MPAATSSLPPRTPPGVHAHRRRCAWTPGGVRGHTTSPTQTGLTGAGLRGRGVARQRSSALTRRSRRRGTLRLNQHRVGQDRQDARPHGRDVGAGVTAPAVPRPVRPMLRRQPVRHAGQRADQLDELVTFRATLLSIRKRHGSQGCGSTTRGETSAPGRFREVNGSFGPVATCRPDTVPAVEATLVEGAR